MASRKYSIEDWIHDVGLEYVNIRRKELGLPKIALPKTLPVNTKPTPSDSDKGGRG